MEQRGCLEAECMFGQMEWSDVQGAGGVSFLLSAALSSSLLSCGGGGSAGICHNTQVPTANLCLVLTLADFPSPLMFLQGWRSYLGMRKDEWTYLLEQKCPNKARNHKSAIVNLGETKLPFARIYLFCTNRQLTLEKKKKKKKFISSPKFMSKKYKLCLQKTLCNISRCIRAKKYWAFLNNTAELSLSSVPICVSDNRWQAVVKVFQINQP